MKGLTMSDLIEGYLGKTVERKKVECLRNWIISKVQQD